MDCTWHISDMHLLVTDIYIYIFKVETWIRKPVSIWWPPCCTTSPSPRVDQAFDCGVWHVVPLPFNGCAKLLDIGGNWNTLSIQSIPNMLNGWHVWWVGRPWKNWDIFSFQELCTNPSDMGLCVIMLKHEVIAAVGLRISSRYLSAFKLPSVKCNCVHCP